VTLPNFLIVAALGALSFEMAHPSSPDHATAVFGLIGAMLTLGGTLALDRSRTRDEDRRRREDRDWRREHLQELARMHSTAPPEEAALIEELAADDDGR